LTGREAAQVPLSSYHSSGVMAEFITEEIIEEIITK
jgi:hypothetical protein